jgi:hypothetical protein
MVFSTKLFISIHSLFFISASSFHPSFNVARGCDDLHANEPFLGGFALDDAIDVCVVPPPFASLLLLGDCFLLAVDEVVLLHEPPVAANVPNVVGCFHFVVLV